MFLKSIIFGFCLLHLSLSLPVPGDDSEELIQIPRKLFTELMGKRDELIRLQYRRGQTAAATQQEPVKNKIDKVLRKIKQWKNDVVEKAGIEDEVADLKAVMREGKKSVKGLFKAGKEGGKQVIKIGGKMIKIALKIEPPAFTNKLSPVFTNKLS